MEGFLAAARGRNSRYRRRSPYLFSLLGSLIVARPLPVPLWVVVLLQCVQSAVFLALAIGVGLLVARKRGMGAPILENWLSQRKATPLRDVLLTPILAGAALGALIALFGHFIFSPRLPQLSAISEGAFPIWKRFLACFYGGIDEELIMRLFLLSLAL